MMYTLFVCPSYDGQSSSCKPSEGIYMLERYRKEIFNIIIIVLSFLSAFAWKYLIDFMGFSGAGFGVESVGYNPLLIIFMIINIAVLRKTVFSFDRRRFVFSCVLGFVMSCACVSGTQLIYTYKLWGTLKENVIAILAVFGIAIFMIPLSYYLFSLFDAVKGNDSKITDKNGIKKWRFLIYWGIIIIGFIPVFLSQWPINFVYDAPYQVSDYLTNSISTHHPILHTLLLGWAYDIGKSLNNIALGMMFYTIVQILVLSASMARMVYLVRKYTGSKMLTVISLLICVFLPCNPIMSITATKDVLCAAFFVLFLGFFLEIFALGKTNYLNYSCMIIFGTLTSLFRNNMIYAIFIGGVIAILYVKGRKNKISLIIVLSILILLTKICNFGLIKATNATSPTKYRETFPIFLQCLARVALTDEQGLIKSMGIEVLDEIERYIPDYASYNACNADLVKDSANEYLLKTNTLNFFKLWVKVGLRYPGKYVEAILSENMAFWYPLNMPGYLLGDIGASHMAIGNGNEEIEKHSYGFSAINNFYEEMYFWGGITDIPFLGFFMRCAVYCWFYFIILLYGIYSKRNEFCLFALIPVFYLLTCFAGPLVVFRYIFCVAISTPYIVLLFKKSVSVSS